MPEDKKESTQSNSSGSKQAAGVMGALDGIFGDKGPVQLPVGAKDWIAKWAWVFALIGVIIRGFGLLTLLGLGAVFSGLAASSGTFSFFSSLGFGILFLAAEGVLLLISIPGLKNMKLSGWNFAFYAEIVAIVGNLLSFNIFGAVIAAVIGFFFLFQIRSRFSK
jgi:hypothetical protein